MNKACFEVAEVTLLPHVRVQLNRLVTADPESFPSIADAAAYALSCWAESKLTDEERSFLDVDFSV